MFLAFATKSLAACWLLQAFILSAVGYTMGILPAICSSIYPAGVRISGFNFAYNFGMMSFGGLVSGCHDRCEKQSNKLQLTISLSTNCS
jgi:hypothetical protein